jgi:serpin B
MMKRSQLIKTAGVLAVLGLMGCGIGELRQAIAQTPVPAPPIEQPTPTASQPVNQQLVTANTRFGFKLFSQLLQTESTENIVISPSSVAIALGMTYNGASGSTQQAMAEALELQGMSLEEVNQASAALKVSLEGADPAVKLAIANSLWGRQDIQFKPEFLQRNQEFYGAEVASLDFSRTDTVDRINTWVSENTEGKIPEIVDQINPDDVLFLINAIYFKGSWTDEFDPAQTVDRPFSLLDGSQIMQPLMARSGEYRYSETESFQAVSLPYGEGRLSMYVFLPKQGTSLNQFYPTLTAENWETWMMGFRNRPGALQIPKFKLDYSATLNEALGAIGMAPAFDASQADFSGISDASTVINQVQHKTFIEVNEEGTEAAAATSVRIALTSLPMPQEPFEMVVDRPFFFAIRDNQTGTVLFMGSVVNPQS